MNKLYFTKKTISNMKNLDKVIAGAATPATTLCESSKIYDTCPPTSSRNTEGRSRGNGK